MIKKKIAAALALLCGFTIIASCQNSSNEEMVQILKQINKKNNTISNPFNPEMKLAYCDSLLKTKRLGRSPEVLFSKASLLLKAGQEEQSVNIYKNLMDNIDFMSTDEMLPDQAIAYMRLG